MFSNAASPASDTLPEELSRLGIAIPDQALQRIIEAVTLAITPRVSSSVERQIEARVRAEITAEVTANVTAEVSERVAAEVRERVTTEVTSSVTAEVSAKLQASFDARVKAAVQEQLLALYEEIRLQRHRMFGRRTETSAAQLGLFNEAEVLAQGTTAADDQVVLPPASEKPTPKAQGQQARGKRKPLPAELPRVDVLHELPEDQRLCACGTPMVVIGQEVSEQLDIVPMQVRVLRHIRIRYGCPDKAQLPALAPRPLKVLPKSNASAGLLAMLITVKYVDGLPLARF
jgi:transposase